MDCENLKKVIRKVELSDDAKTRIVEKCRSANVDKMEGNIMNKKCERRIRKPAVIAAAVVLCLCLALVAGAAGNFGFFKDVYDYKGAVVGTVYKNAGDEITVSAAVDGEMLVVSAAMVYPDAVPYSEIETLRINKYKIIASNGMIIEEGEQTEAFVIVDGCAEIKLALECDVTDECRLVIDGFMGGKKAEQDLLIEGIWEVAY